MAKRITINDVAQLLRITPESIRFYEKKKIVTPQRDEENGYRYFTQADIRRLYDCRIYQSMGFSLAEVVDIFNDASSERLDHMIREKEAELTRIVEEDMHALRRIRQVKKSEENAAQFYGQFEIRQSGHWLASYHSSAGELDPEAIQHPFWQRVADHYNLFTCLAHITPELAMSEHLGERMKCGYTVDYDTAVKLGLGPGGPVKELRPRRCVYTMFHAEPIVNAQVLAPALEWIRAHQFELTGDILCRTKKIGFRDGGESRIYEAWFPVD